MFYNSLLPQSLTCTLNRGDQIRFHSSDWSYTSEPGVVKNILNKNFYLIEIKGRRFIAPRNRLIKVPGYGYRQITKPFEKDEYAKVINPESPFYLRKGKVESSVTRNNGEYYFYTLSFGIIFKKRALFCESELDMRGRDKIIRRCYFC